jgi:hypothetical protein
MVVSHRFVRRRRRGAELAAGTLVIVLVILVRCAHPGDQPIRGASTDCAAGTSLLADCGFELPLVAVGGYTTFVSGTELSSWTVVGANGNVAPLSNSYSSLGISWSAHEGVQTLDLTGLSNSATGVSQSIATRSGQRYTLSFWVGNVVDPTGEYGTTSTVDVFVDDHRQLTATNSDGAGLGVLVWKQFTVAFTASTTPTNLAFVNADPVTDNSNIIDDIVLAEG